MIPRTVGAFLVGKVKDELFSTPEEAQEAVEAIEEQIIANDDHIGTVYTDADAALRYLDAHPAPIVVKASGLAAGKGAIVCQTDEEARSAVRQIMVERAFGAAGDQLVIEEFLTGQEVSVLAFADGRNVAPMILAQDHKAIMDGDRGPNTGGMGAYAPAPVIDRALLDQVVARVLQPTVDALRDAGSPYQGVLYAGLMVDRNAPPERCFRVLEFNCRFGDPEAQAILPLLQTDLVDVLEACIDGRLAEIDLRWAPQSCVCVVMASAGYPGRYASGAEIRIDTAYIDAHPNVTVFHAGTRRDGERLLTAGGRVLGVTAWDVDLPAAIAQAYAAVEHIHWNGALYRRDIGAKGITQS